jgi:hypothetical protein
MSAATTIGGAAVAAVGAVGAILAIKRDAPLWLTIGCVVIIALAVIAVIWNAFLRPGEEPAAPVTRSLVDGDADLSTFRDVSVSGADRLINGNARGALFERIQFWR